MHQAMMTPEIRECIKNCLDCHSICSETVTHCLTLGGRHAEHHHIGLMLDCAQICSTSADFMLRGSPRHVDTCDLCSTICRQCADECSRMADGDETMLRCAEICNRCAESCHRMAMTAA